MKGKYYDKCRRTTCPNDNATYYNFSTREHYCKHCANLINSYNRLDAQKTYGHDLCLPVIEVISRSINDDCDGMALHFEILDYYREIAEELADQIEDFKGVFKTNEKEEIPKIVYAVLKDNTYAIYWEQKNVVVRKHFEPDMIKFASYLLSQS